MSCELAEKNHNRLVQAFGQLKSSAKTATEQKDGVGRYLARSERTRSLAFLRRTPHLFLLSPFSALPPIN